MLKPLPPKEWDRWKAAHLLTRAGFGCTEKELNHFASINLDDAVDSLVNWEKTPETWKNPDWAKPDPERFQAMREMRKLSEEERKKKRRELGRLHRTQSRELTIWWLERMLGTSRPLQEKITLFWHDHFATSSQKVKDPYYMWKQNETLRQHAKDSFHAMLLAVTRDPAMLIWLDGRLNKRRAPNENYARELLELFSLGEGNYTENDIHEGARALTGWDIDRRTQESVFRKKLHDPGSKTFLGKSGKFEDRDLIGIILTQPACAEFMARNLWEFFVQPDPPESVVHDLAEILRKNDYAIAPALNAIFHSEAFYSPQVIRQQIKGPIQWLIGMIKSLEIDIFPPRIALEILNRLGQVPFLPPSVKGWDKDRAWITTSTYLFRCNVSRMLVHGADRETLTLFAKDSAKKVNALLKASGTEADPTQLERTIARRLGSSLTKSAIHPDKLVTGNQRDNPKKLISSLYTRLHHIPPTEGQIATIQSKVQPLASPASDENIRAVIEAILISPEYQLA